LAGLFRDLMALDAWVVVAALVVPVVLTPRAARGSELQAAAPLSYAWEGRESRDRRKAGRFRGLRLDARSATATATASALESEQCAESDGHAT
jgi:hypothetical protein